MKTSIVLLFPVIAACAAGQAAKQPAAQAPPAQTQPLKPTQIPAGAVEAEPGFFRYTDPAGKKWVFRRTPFGVSKGEDKLGDTPKSTAFEDNTKAFEQGDAVRFERTTPFGVSKWTRNKAELDDQERFIWERDKTQSDKSKQDKK
jgi:hypothetical protein